jgi:hypothetical protein
MYYAGDGREVAGKKAIMGALRLYLDFINLFMMLLQLMGTRAQLIAAPSTGAPRSGPRRSATPGVPANGARGRKSLRVACNSILDRAFGRPAQRKESEPDSIEARIANMTRVERLQRMHELLTPMRQHLHELDNEAEIAAEAD